MRMALAPVAKQTGNIPAPACPARPSTTQRPAAAGASAILTSLALMAMLSGCLGDAGSPDNPVGTTHVAVAQFGSLQGLSIHDGKDRQSVFVSYRSQTAKGCEIPKRPDLCERTTAHVALETRDSNGSTAQAAALQAQAENVGKALDLVGSTVGAAVKLAPIPVPK